MTSVISFGDGAPHLGPAVVALGVFDGVHLGHQALLADTVALANARDVGSCVLTFDRDPDQVVTPERVAPQLMTLEDKVAFLAESGPDAVLVVPFTSELAALSPERFLDDVVMAAVTPIACVVGRDFRFGSRARGDLATLTEFGVRHDFEAVGHDLVTVDGLPVTSTRIRNAVAAGDVEGAARLLGRAHRVTGEVVHGRGAGVALGAPTANIRTPAFAAVPGDGVYAARAHLRGTPYAAAVSLGLPPTFPEARDTCEAHLIGYSGAPFYGERILLEFVARLRDQRRFHSADALADAIASDIRAIEAILGASEDT